MFALDNHYELHVMKQHEAERAATQQQLRREARSTAPGSTPLRQRMGRWLVAVGTQLAEQERPVAQERKAAGQRA